MADNLCRTFRLGEIEVEVREGDITRVDTEAITNAANSRLFMGAGVAGAIKKAGGSAVEEEAVSKGPIPVGSAIETTAGNLPYRYVLHGAVMGPDLRTSAELIAETTRSCLSLADSLALRSLALPAFGTGVGGFSMTECGRIMAEEVRAFAAQKPVSLKRIVFVLWGEKAYNEFLSGAQAVLGG